MHAVFDNFRLGAILNEHAPLPQSLPVKVGFFKFREHKRMKA